MVANPVRHRAGVFLRTKPMPTEAAIVAICEAVKAICGVVEKAMDGQSAEQKAKMWQWYVDDVTAWRRLWGLEK